MVYEIKRDTVDYRDPTPFDNTKLNSLSDISKALRHKTYGEDTREAIAQQGEALAKLMQEMGGNQSAEVASARGNFELLGIREDAQDNAIVKAQSTANGKFDTSQAESYLRSITALPETFANLDEIKNKYPSGKNGLMVAADNGHKYIWANNVWTDAGVYQSVGIADGSISPAKFDDSIKQNLFKYDTLPLIPKLGFYSTFNNTFNDSDEYLSLTSACKPGELFSCSTKIKEDTMVAVVMFFKDESCTQYHSHLLGGVAGVYNDYAFSIPEGVMGFAVSSTVDYSPVIKKCNTVAIKDFMQKTENQLSYTSPLDGEFLNGFYSTINDILNETTEYKSLKAHVSAGDKIVFNAVCSTNTLATCVFWNNAGNKLLTIKGGEIGKWANVEAVAPPNTSFVTITSTAQNPPSAIIQQPINGAALMHTVGNIKPLMFTRKLDDRLEILSKYDTTKDLKLTFGRISTNNTWQFSGAWLLNNTGKSVNSDFDRATEDYINAVTDYVSPIYNLRAINNINGDQPDSKHYTGGWHGYDNANSGTATARTISCKVFVDGFELGNEIVNGYETKLIVTNLVQGTNTKKVDGSGREILQEKITYTIVCGNINVEAEYTALEDLTISGYSFLQFQMVYRFHSKFIAYDDDDHRKWIDNLSSDIYGGDKTISSTNCMQFTGESDKCTMFYDPNFGLGKMQYNNSYRWCYRNYEKGYFNLINPSDSPITFRSGDVFACRGGYKFETL
ncbi:hypothetical protein [Latilactobacillus curvatus]|uniref:hypothetical protein n=1 Tax=Latilactobacillus curvatus TaxID=28038 RepID=UPI0028B5A9A1|nr:hypothetical protein [Latilactobacillus curvatus]MDT7016994.1 hypothetical protein [Latilactobacillus curvatus]